MLGHALDQLSYISPKTARIIKKAFCFMRKLKQAIFDAAFFFNLCEATTVWFGNYSEADKKALQRIIKFAQK